jgi:twitching motility protein PilJ
MTTNAPESISLTDSLTDEDRVSTSPTAAERVEESRSRPTNKRSIWSSIRIKATLLAVAIGTIPVVAIGSAAYYFANRSFNEKVALEQQDKTIELADKLNLFMFERFGDIQVLAEQPFLVDPKVKSALTPEQKQAALDRYAELYEVYDSIVVTDLEGNVTIAAGKTKTLDNIAFRDYFKQARAGRVFISEPDKSKVTGKLSLFLAAPLRDKVTNEVIGTIRTRIPGEKLERLARNYVEGKQEYLFANASGKIFAGNDPNVLEQDSTLLFPGINPLIAQEKAGTIYANFGGGTTLVGFSPVTKFENMPPLSWSILTIADADITFKAQRDLLLVLGSGIAISALLVSALAAWIANRGTQPIAEAAAAVEKVGRGELDTRIETKGNDELAILGENINQMAGQIQTLLNDAKESSAQIQAQNKVIVEESDVLQADVGHILDVVSAVEDGDLTVEADVSDRATGLVSDTLNRLIEQLGQVLGQVLVSAQQVSTRSGNLEELAKTVSGNAIAQAQEAQRVLELTRQVQASANSSADRVNQSNQSLADMGSTIEQGQGELDTMNLSIGVLEQGTDRIVQQMKALGEFVGLAEQFVQDQGQIASLTQVLALNATLVAARASEQRDPRQFMVVAREFEAIANQVSGLAKQTNDGLLSLQQRTNQIQDVVLTIDSEVQGLGALVSGFTTGVEQANEVFGNVRAVTGRVTKAGEAVAQSNQEIVNAAQQTAKAMDDIASLADRTAQLTQNTQAQAEQMENLSAQLLKTIQFFRLPESVLQASRDVQSDTSFLPEQILTHDIKAEEVEPALSLASER